MLNVSIIYAIIDNLPIVNETFSYICKKLAIIEA